MLKKDVRILFAIAILLMPIVSVPDVYGASKGSRLSVQGVVATSKKPNLIINTQAPVRADAPGARGEAPAERQTLEGQLSAQEWLGRSETPAFEPQRDLPAATTPSEGAGLVGVARADAEGVVQSTYRSPTVGTFPAFSSSPVLMLRDAPAGQANMRSPVLARQPTDRAAAIVPEVRAPEVVAYETRLAGKKARYKAEADGFGTELKSRLSDLEDKTRELSAHKAAVDAIKDTESDLGIELGVIDTKTKKQKEIAAGVGALQKKIDKRSGSLLKKAATGQLIANIRENVNAVLDKELSLKDIVLGRVNKKLQDKLVEQQKKLSEATQDTSTRVRKAADMQKALDAKREAERLSENAESALKSAKQAHDHLSDKTLTAVLKLENVERKMQDTEQALAAKKSKKLAKEEQALVQQWHAKINEADLKIQRAEGRIAELSQWLTQAQHNLQLLQRPQLYNPYQQRQQSELAYNISRAYTEIELHQNIRAETLKQKQAGALEALGLAVGAGQTAIKKNYYRLAKELHPDKTRALPETERKIAEAKFKMINESYEILKPAQSQANLGE